MSTTAVSAPTETERRLAAAAQMRQNLNPHGHRFGRGLAPASWTPLHLQLLLHYYTMADALPNHSAPAVLAYTEDLVREQLIEKAATPHRGRSGHGWQLTKRGEAHVKALTSAALPHQATGMTNLCQEVFADAPPQPCILGTGTGGPTPRPVTKAALDEIMGKLTGECVRYAAALPVVIEEGDGGTITGFDGPFLLLEDVAANPADREQFLICFPDQDGPGYTLKRTIPVGLSGDISQVLANEQEDHPFLVWNLSEKQWSRALKVLPEYQQRRARIARIATESSADRARLPRNPFATDYSIKLAERPADYSSAVAIRRRSRGDTGPKSDTHGPPDSHGS